MRLVGVIFDEVSGRLELKAETAAELMWLTPVDDVDQSLIPALVVLVLWSLHPQAKRLMHLETT